MTKIEMVVKVLQARLNAYLKDVEYTESAYGKDSFQAIASRGRLCECSTTLDMLLGSEEVVSNYYDIWYK